MKHLSLTALALGLLAATPSHALFGLGVSYGANTATVDNETGAVPNNVMPEYLTTYAAQKGYGVPTLEIERAKVSGLQQIGVKAWVDIPLTDISVDLGTNVAWGSYKSSVVLLDDKGVEQLNIPTGLNTSFPVWGIGSGETPYVNLLNDLTVRYTFLNFPPVVSLLKVSAGAGATFVYGTRVVGKDDIKELLTGTPTSGLTPAQVEQQLNSKLSDNLYTTTIGGHLDLNVTVKPPVIPLAIYVDAKWYLHTATSKATDGYPLAVSGGLAFAI